MRCPVLEGSTTNFSYNVAGELTQITYPSGRVVQQSVDAIGRLCEVAPSSPTGCGSASSPYATGFGYSVASQLTGFKYGNGIYASLGYSSDGRLQLNCLDYSTTNRGNSCTHDSTTKFGLTYYYKTDPTYCTSGTTTNNGQIQCIADYVDNGRSIAYTFDPLYRLFTATTTGSANYAAWGLKQSYDRYGNRWSQSVSSGCTGVTCPQPSVSYTAATNQISGSPYTYDLSGNMTNDGVNTIAYDAENHAVSNTNGSAVWAYTYDGNGNRVQKVSGSTTTVYIFSGAKVIAEYDNGAAVGSPSREYIYGGAGLLAKIDSTGTKYYHQDHLSNRLVTDSSGNTYAQLGHFPFGERWYNTTTDKFQFTTYERDAESGNDYAMARSYVNRLAAFSSKDPIPGDPSDPQNLDGYLYTRDEPVDFYDPSGMVVAPPGQCDSSIMPCDGSIFDPAPTVWVMYGWVSIPQEIWGQLFVIDFSNGSTGQPIGTTGGGDNKQKKPKCDAEVPGDRATARLAQLVYAEGNGTAQGDLAVASVVVNRANYGNPGEFGNGILGAINKGFAATGNTLFKSVATQAKVSALNGDSCARYKAALAAAVAAQTPGGTNTDAEFFWDITQGVPPWLRSAIQAGSVTQASVPGGIGQNGYYLQVPQGFYGNDQMFFMYTGYNH